MYIEILSKDGDRVNVKFMKRGKNRFKWTQETEYMDLDYLCFKIHQDAIETYVLNPKYIVIHNLNDIQAVYEAYKLKYFT